MRVVLSTYGSRGDVEPIVALGLALAGRGARVHVCAPPDLGWLAEEAGLEFSGAGRHVQEMATVAMTGKVKVSLPEITAELAAAFHEAVRAAAAPAGGAAAVAVVSAGVIGAQAGARSAADLLGVPYFGTTFSTNAIPTAELPPMRWPGQPAPDDAGNEALWKLNAEHLGTLFGPPVDAQRAAAGLPPAGNVRDHVLGERTFLASDPVLGPCTPLPGYDVAQTGAWIRPDKRPLPGDVEAFLADGPPPVYAGFGSMPLRDAAATGRAVIEAVRGAGRRLVLGSGWAGLSGELTGADDAVLTIGEVNQQALFPRVAAVVHHGGAGTTTTAARAGAPQVIVPQVADQPYWASRVAELGAGVAHDGPLPTTESLSAALEVALASRTRDRAAALVPAIRADGAAVAADLVLGA
ncbi:glycosyltransferase [Myceligenerans crystallogenes]|uniref:Glycosyltransferase n=1 Tax=Myceligenerans crystallogenes TaxID=316335 RepID=A0ABN2N7V9_9MICO